MRSRIRTFLTAALWCVTIAAGTTTATAQAPSPQDGTDGGDDLLSRLTGEQVEPGVLRVLSDGYRELSRDPTDTDVYQYWSQFQRTHAYRYIVAAPDGSVWVMEDGRFFRVGAEATYDLDHQPRVYGHDDIEVAPDGTLWRVASIRLRSFDGKGWTRYRQKQQFCGVEVQPDGTTWAIWGPHPATGSGGCIVDTLGRWDGTRWRVYDVPRAWPSYGSQFAVTGDDEVWICCAERAWAPQQRLVRFDGRRFQSVDDPAPQQDRRNDAPLLIDGSADGTLWMRRTSTTLARHDEGGWTVFTAADDGVPQMGWVVGGGFLRAGPDGSVWVTISKAAVSDAVAPACDGIAHFDGLSWTHYLRDTCAFALDIAPDGTAWLQAANVGSDVLNDVQQGRPVEPIQTYVIDPSVARGPDDSSVVTSSPSPSATRVAGRQRSAMR